MFWQYIKDVAINLGFEEADADECLFVSLYEGSKVILVVYVDDFIIAGERSGVDHFFDLIAARMEISDRGYVEVGKTSNLLGVSTTRDEAGNIHINQQGYIIRMLEKYEADLHENSTQRICSTPVVSWAVNQWTEPVLDTDLFDKSRYLEAIGELLYLATASRPDLGYVASRLAQFSHKPSVYHWKGFLRILRYLKATSDLHLVYKNNPNAPLLEMFSDADFAYNTSTRRCQSGCIIKVLGNTVLWQSSKQRSVVTSTLEAEYVAYARAAKNALWVSNLLKYCMPDDILNTNSRALSFCDNQACIASLQNDICRSTSLRHIDVSYRFVRELISRGTLRVEYISSALQVADILTKPLERVALERLTAALGMTHTTRH